MKSVLAKIRFGDGGGLSILSSFVAVIGGLLVGLIVLFISYYQQAFAAFTDILTFGFQSLRNFGQVLYFATPIILTGLSVGFAMKTGLFNIGASGQYTFGALAAVYVALEFTFLPPPVRIAVSLLCAMLAGAAWGAIPGLLKAYRNVHEVISCIMTNWIGVLIVNYIILNSIWNSVTNATFPVPRDANMPGWGLPELFQGDATRPPPINSGIVFAVLAAIAVYVIISKTKFGYELKACGFNRDAAKYAGINEKRNIVYSMMISGSLAGLGGALYFLSGAGVVMRVSDVLATEGFTGISVALLGLAHPIGIIFSGILVAYLQMGGWQMQILGFAPEIIDIVISVIIYFCAFVLLIKMFLARSSRRLRRQPHVSPAHGEPPPPGLDLPLPVDDEPPLTAEPAPPPGLDLPLPADDEPPLPSEPAPPPGTDLPLPADDCFHSGSEPSSGAVRITDAEAAGSGKGADAL